MNAMVWFSATLKVKRKIPAWRILFMGILMGIFCPAGNVFGGTMTYESQMKTIAFNGLAFLTGGLCSDTFFPPGKVSDFFGFQYMHDIMPNGFGHTSRGKLHILFRSGRQCRWTSECTMAGQCAGGNYHSLRMRLFNFL